MKTHSLFTLLAAIACLAGSLATVPAQTYPAVDRAALTLSNDGTITGPVSASTFRSKNNLLSTTSSVSQTITSSLNVVGDVTASGTVWGEMAAFVDATVSGTLNVTGNLQATSPTTTHLMTVFAETGSTGVGLLLYTSRDGVNFTPASKSWLYQVAPDGVYGTFRDPKLLKFGEYFYVTFTTNFPAPYQYPTWPAKFGMIKSKDLIHWTNVTTPDLSAQLAAATPSEYIWTSGFLDIDGTKYVIAQAAAQPAVNYAVPFYPSATGTDTFGSPIQITGAFPGNKCTVSNIVKVGSTYHLQFSDYGGALDPGYISIGNMTSSSPFTGYAGPTLFIHNGEGAPTAVTNLDGTPYITSAGKYRVNFRSFAGANQYIDTADFVSTSSAVTLSPGYGAASYVPGYTVRNVGVTVANDLQTEQVISALERDVIANKVGLADNNNFTGVNTFSEATGTLSGVVRMKSGASFTSPATLTFSSTTPDGTDDTQWVFTGDRSYGVSFIVENRANNTESPAGINFQKPGNTWTVTNTNFLLSPSSGKPSLRFINQGNATWPFVVDGDTDYFGIGLGNTVRPVERLDVGGKVRAVAYKFTSGSEIYSGSGSPEGAVTASVGSLYLRADGGAGTTLYVKQSGTGNTGWVAK